jgi:hypothetical protein
MIRTTEKPTQASAAVRKPVGLAGRLSGYDRCARKRATPLRLKDHRRIFPSVLRPWPESLFMANLTTSGHLSLAFTPRMKKSSVPYRASSCPNPETSLE